MLIWILFLAFVSICLALDLGVFNKNPHVIHAREAFRWTALWASLALAFTGIIYFGYENNWLGMGQMEGAPELTGGEAAIQYLTGYLVELSLSMDNVFVIALIFSFFGIEQRYQHRVLFWGILGAIFFRGVMILLGAQIVARFEEVFYVFGAILLYSAYKMWNSGSDEIHPDQNPVVKAFRKIMPVTATHQDDHFFIRENGVRMATPAFIALLVIETTDIIFAFDSIPAIFAITRDPFIVFSSNIFAIMGLRSLYFVLASMMDRFHLLKYALVIVLAYVGIKSILLPLGLHVPPLVSLGVIILVLGTGVVLSLRQRPTTIEDIDKSEPTPEHAHFD